MQVGRKITIKLSNLRSYIRFKRNKSQERKEEMNMKKRVMSLLLALVMVFSVTTPAMAATKKNTKTSTKTITFVAGYYDVEGERFNGDATIKVTNVTSQKTKDYSVDLSDGTKTYTFEGEKCKVIYCKTKTTITLKPNKDLTTAEVFGLTLYSDVKTANSVTWKGKYYDFDSYTERVGKVKYDTVPEDSWVIADGSSYTITKAGTYVLYVRPFGYYGTDGEDFKLNPVFIVVK